MQMLGNFLPTLFLLINVSHTALTWKFNSQNKNNKKKMINKLLKLKHHYLKVLTSLNSRVMNFRERKSLRSLKLYFINLKFVKVSIGLPTLQDLFYEHQYLLWVSVFSVHCQKTIRDLQKIRTNLGSNSITKYGLTNIFVLSYPDSELCS